MNESGRMYEVEPGKVLSPREMENPTFDLNPPHQKNNNNSQKNGHRNMAKGMSIEEVYSVIKLKPPPKKTWEPDVKALISTSKWLSTYGLKRNRLTLDQILGTIGFKHSDDFDHALKKPVCSRYGEGLFKRYPKRDGRVYNVNVAVSKEKIKQIENSLLQAINLYKRRIEWLTSESRRLFGVIEEHCICIVIDVKSHSPTQFDHCRNAIIRVLEEQVSEIAKFNLIRAAQDMVTFQDSALPVTKDSLDQAINWIRGLDSVAASTKTSACEGIMKAFQDRNIECVYLFSEGNSADTAMELMLQKVRGGPLPINTVAFNSANSTTVKFLKDVAKGTGGRFHAFAFNKLDSDVSGTSGYTKESEILQGGVPPGAGARDDVVAMWAVLEEARSVLGDLQTLGKEVPDAKEQIKEPPHEHSPKFQKSEQYMSSREWLDKHGIRSRKLDVYDVLASCSFRHCDGVVDVKRPPSDDYTDADTMNKLVNAKYCDKFCHFQWKDGSMKHVHVTADVHRDYERRMLVAIQDFQRRVDWLQQGSRELFGTIVEDQVYILIDVSNSMENHLSLVKEKLYKLMQEQLRHKIKFNLVKFGSKAHAWRDRMLEVNESSLQSAWQWVRELGVAGSTNTLSALKIALGDPMTQAVYLLSDGRPDHPPKTILAQVQLQRNIPIHTISFNCNDVEANDFLALLAADTGGRYHYYSDDMTDQPHGPTPYESEDVRLLKEEMKKGRDDLKKLAHLREQCALLDWSNNHHRENTGCGKDHGIKKRPISATGVRPASQVLSRESPTPPRSARPRSAHSHHMRRPMSSLSFSSSFDQNEGRSRTTTYPPKPQSQRRGGSNRNKPNMTYHTKTSWLRLKGSLDGWMLPETQHIMNEQQMRYISALSEIAKEKEVSKKTKGKKKKSDSLQMSSRLWLKKNGLAAKKLTIFDALGGTLVRQKAKYIPILDKYVTSQVFNEIMPLAHVTDNKQEVNLINPNAIDLEGYEEKLQKAIQLYHRRLDRLAWSALDRQEKEKFGCDEPISYIDNRKDYLVSFDALGWPIPEKDIILLEEEIEKGERFLHQSRSLRQATKQKKSQPSVTIGSHVSPRTFPRARDTPDRLKDLLQKVEESDDDSGSEKEKRSLKKGSSNRSSSEEHSSHSEKSDSEGEKELAKLKEDSNDDEEDRHGHEESDSEKLFTRRKALKKIPPKNKVAKTHSRRTKVVNRLRHGTKVISRNTEDGLYYPGVISQSQDARHVEVKFAHLGRKVVASRFVVETHGARAQPMLRTGDYVLVRGLKGKAEVWVPGVVQFGPKDETKSAKFYTIITYNKNKINVGRSSVIKIAQARYNFMVRYIATIKQPSSALFLDANPLAGEPRLSTDGLDEPDGVPKYSFLVRPSSRSNGAQTENPKSRNIEVQADETSPEDIREILKDLQEQMLQNDTNNKQTQEVLKEELKETIKHRQQLDELQDQLRQKHEDLLEQHSTLQRESDKVLHKHHKLRKRHTELKGRHGQLKGDRVDLEGKKKETDERLLELETKHLSLQSDYGELQTQHKDLESKLREEEEKRHRKVDSSIQTNDIFIKDESELNEENKDGEELKDDADKKEETDVGDGENALDEEQKEPEEEQKEEEMKMKSLIGEEVLAQSPEDGWFYRGTIESASEEGDYFVADSGSSIQKVPPDRVLTEEEDAEKYIQTGDAVVALHPEHPFRYGPGIVGQISSPLWYHVKFYDGTVADIPREEMYFISKDLMEEVKEKILAQEDRWMGHAVVVRNDHNGVYYLGTARDRPERGNMYVIEWADGQMVNQYSRHIFGAFSHRHRMALGDHVLAMTSPINLTYLPGQIKALNGSKLVVQFIDGTSSNSVDSKQCFWLSELYYSKAKDFYQEKAPPVVKHSSSESESESSSSSSSEGKLQRSKEKLKGRSRKKSESSSSSSMSLLD